MATIKLKTPDANASNPSDSGSRPPVRGTGAGVRARPTLAQAQTQRIEREAQYQEQQRQRFGDRPAPGGFNRRDEPGRGPARGPSYPRRDESANFQPRREESGQGGPRRDVSAPPYPRRDDAYAPRPQHHDAQSSYPRRDAQSSYPRRDAQPSYPRRDDAFAPRPQRNDAASSFQRNDASPYQRRDQAPRRDEPRQAAPYGQRDAAPYGQRDGMRQEPRDSMRGGPRDAAPAPFRQRNTPYQKYQSDAAPQSGQRNEFAPAQRPRRELPPARDARGDNRGDNRGDSRDDSRGDNFRANPVNTAFGQRDERGPYGQQQAPQHGMSQGPAHGFPTLRQSRQQIKDRAFDNYRSDDRDDHEPAEHLPGSVRLSKRMSELGIASRREADEWIAQGWVRVDDQIVKELGSRVMPGQRVTVDAKAKYQQAQRVTVLINKPVGYVSGQAEDGYEPAVVLVTPENQWREDHSGTRYLKEHLRSLVPAGRLDIDSVGLLVLTQDGRVAKQLIGEDSNVEKEYLVRVAMPGGMVLSDDSLSLLRHGLELDGEALLPAHVEWVNDNQLRFVLNQGKKRQIRRMCEAVGLQVLGLKRVRIGAIMLGDLPTGMWRYLRMDEGFVMPEMVAPVA